MRQDNLIGYADLERLGWSNYLIDDYLGLKREVVAQRGTDVDPNGIYEANLNGFYVDIATPQLWFNSVIGATTGWIAL
jgi:hypothetical protein